MFPSLLPHECLAFQAERSPEALAIFIPFPFSQLSNRADLCITYRELKRRIDRLSAYLLKQNFPKDTVISVCFKEDVNYIIAAFAIWQAGFVYMPFVLKQGEEKISAHLEKLDDPILLTDDENHIRVKKIYWSDVKEGVEEEVSFPSRTLESPAYICCSSGTASEPKLIQNRFEGLIRRADALARLLMPNEEEAHVLLGFCRPDFDASLMDWLMALCVKGATLCLAPEFVTTNVFHYLPQLFKKANESGHPITAAVLLPTILSGPDKVSGINPLDYPGLKRVITMGDKSNKATLVKLMDAGVDIYEGYGPTEAAIAASAGPIYREKEITLGKPLPGVTFYLVNEQAQVQLILDGSVDLSSLPILEGLHEIYIGGEGVGSYLAASEENNARFLDASNQSEWPFLGSQRVFRTGDFVTVNQEGMIFQSRGHLKWRGTRAYPHVIEAPFNALKNQVNALVQQVKVGVMNDQLLLCVVPTSVDVDAIALLAQLQEAAQQLPPNMRPDHYIQIESFPETARHKLASIEEALAKQPAKLLQKRFDDFVECTPDERAVAHLVINILLPPLQYSEIPLSANADLRDFGLDSTNISRLICMVWNTFLSQGGGGISGEFAVAFHRMPSIRSISELVQLYQFNSVTLYHEAELTAPPMFFIKMLASDEADTIFNTENNVLQTYRLSSQKSFSSEEGDILSRGESGVVQEKWRLALLQLLRGIRMTQPHGPYHLAAFREDYWFLDAIAETLRKQNEVVFCTYGDDVVHENVQKLLLETRCHQVLASSEILLMKQQQQNKRDHVLPFPIFALSGYFDRQPISDVGSFLYSLLNKEEVKNKCLILRGDYGSGRKTLLFNIRDQLWECYLQDKKRLPIFIDFVGINEPNPVEVFLLAQGLTEEHIKVLKELPIIFLVNGYDETGRHDYPDVFQCLKDQGWKNASCVLSVQSIFPESALALHKGYADYQTCSLQYVEADGLNIDPSVIQHMKITPSLILSWKAFKKTQRFEESVVEDFYWFYVKNVFDQWLTDLGQYHFQLDPSSYDIGIFLDYVKNFIAALGYEVNFQNMPSSLEEAIQEEKRLYFYHHPYFDLLKRFLIGEGERIIIPSWLNVLASFPSEVLNNDMRSLNRHVFSRVARLLSSEELYVVIEETPSVDPMQMAEGLAPLFLLVPLTGETPAAYQQLAHALGPQQPVYTLRLSPTDPACLSRSEDMQVKANFFANIIEKIQPGGDILLAGWSFGGLLSFYVAIELEKRGRRIALLLNIDCSPPLSIENIPVDKRAYALVLGLLKNYQLNNFKEALDKFLVEHPRKESENVIDYYFLCAIQFLDEHIIAGNFDERQKRLAQKLKRGYQYSQVNLKTCYSLADNDDKLQSTTLTVVEAGYKAGVSTSRECLAASGWEDKVVFPEKQLRVFPFHDTDHDTIFRSQVFFDRFRQLVQSSQRRVSSMPLVYRMQNYLHHTQTTMHQQAIYVSTQVSDSVKEFAETHVLFDEVQDQFLRESKKVLLLHGHAGAGKTYFLQWLFKKLASIYDENNVNSYFPLYIRLKIHPEQSIQLHLLELGFTEEEIENSLKHHRIIFLLDGYDESNAQQAFIKAQLTEWPHAKCIVTCRSEYLMGRQKYVDIFCETEEALLERYIPPFSDTQIDDYLLQYAANTNVVSQVRVIGLYGRPPEVFNHQQALNQYPGLNQLIRNPLILSMVVVILPRLNANVDPELRFKVWTRADVFCEFIQWHYQQVETSLQVTQGMLSGFHLQQAFDEYGEQLALAEFTRDDELRRHLCVENAYLLQSRRACFVEVFEENKGQIFFIHPTYTEFYFAQWLVMCLMNDKIMPWGLLSFTRNFSLLQFIAERIQSLGERGERLVEILWMCILRTKDNDDPQLMLAAANAITLLNMMGYSFSGKDLAGIKIPGAYLGRGFFSHTRLVGANLREVDLGSTYLQDADLTQADLEGMQHDRHALPALNGIEKICFHPKDSGLLALQHQGYSSFPNGLYLYHIYRQQFLAFLSDLSQKLTAMCFSSDGKTLMLGYASGDIFFWDMESYGCTKVANVQLEVKQLLLSPSDHLAVMCMNSIVLLNLKMSTQYEFSTPQNVKAFNGVAFLGDEPALLITQDDSLGIWYWKNNQYVVIQKMKLIMGFDVMSLKGILFDPHRNEILLLGMPCGIKSIPLSVGHEEKQTKEGVEDPYYGKLHFVGEDVVAYSSVYGIVGTLSLYHLSSFRLLFTRFWRQQGMSALVPNADYSLVACVVSRGLSLDSVSSMYRHARIVFCADYGDSKHLCVLHENGCVELMNQKTRQINYRRHLYQRFPSAVFVSASFNSETKDLIIFFANGVLARCTILSSKINEVTVLKFVEDKTFFYAAFNQQGNLLVTVERENPTPSIYLVDVNSGMILRTWEWAEQQGEIIKLGFSPNNKFFFTIVRGVEGVSLWDTEEDQRVCEFKNFGDAHNNFMKVAEFSSDSQRLVCIGGYHHLDFFDLAHLAPDLKPQASFGLPSFIGDVMNPVSYEGYVFIPDRALCVVISRISSRQRFMLSLWRYDEENCTLGSAPLSFVGELPWHVLSVQVMNNGATLLMHSENLTIQCWDVREDETLQLRWSTEPLNYSVNIKTDCASLQEQKVKPPIGEGLPVAEVINESMPYTKPELSGLQMEMCSENEMEPRKWFLRKLQRQEVMVDPSEAAKVEERTQFAMGLVNKLMQQGFDDAYIRQQLAYTIWKEGSQSTFYRENFSMAGISVLVNLHQLVNIQTAPFQRQVFSQMFHQVFFLHAMSCVRSSQYENAWYDLNALLQLFPNPNAPQRIRLRALYFYAKGEYHEAIVDFNDLCASQSASASDLHNLALALWLDDQKEIAGFYFENALASQASASIHVMYGHYLLASGAVEGAIEQFNAAIQNPNDSSFLTFEAHESALLNDSDLSEDIPRVGGKLFLNPCELAYYCLIKLYVTSQREEEASALFAEFMSLVEGMKHKYATTYRLLSYSAKVLNFEEVAAEYLTQAALLEVHYQEAIPEVKITAQIPQLPEREREEYSQESIKQHPLFMKSEVSSSSDVGVTGEGARLSL